MGFQLQPRGTQRQLRLPPPGLSVREFRRVLGTHRDPLSPQLKLVQRTKALSMGLEGKEDRVRRA